MCRMLAVVNRSAMTTRRLLMGFREQAAGSRAGIERPERHPDGWGLVAARDGSMAYLGRSAGDAAADPAYEEAVKRVDDTHALVLAHLRQRSVGSRRLQDAHPFLRDGWAFCHNGTVENLRDDPHVRYEGTTDSERVFHAFLSRLGPGLAPEAAMRELVATLPPQDYSSLTCLLTDGRAVFGLRKVGTLLRGHGSRAAMKAYYGLAVARLDETWILAQEPTGLAGVTDWREVPDDGFVALRPGAAPLVQAAPAGPL